MPFPVSLKKGQFHEIAVSAKGSCETGYKNRLSFFTSSAFVEYFAYFGNSNLNRFGTQMGGEMRVTKHLNYEAYWNLQFSNSPDLAINDAFGMSLKFFFKGDNEFKVKKKNQR